MSEHDYITTHPNALEQKETDWRHASAQALTRGDGLQTSYSGSDGFVECLRPSHSSLRRPKLAAVAIKRARFSARYAYLIQSSVAVSYSHRSGVGSN